MKVITQKHIEIIEELKKRAVEDKSKLDGVLLNSEKDLFCISINALESTKKRLKIDLLEQEKKNVEDQLSNLND